MENQNTYDRAEEIDLVSLLVTLARKYRQIIAGMLIGAILLGGGGAVKKTLDKRAAEAAKERGEKVSYTDDELKYEQELVSYYTEKSEHDKAINEYNNQLRSIQVEQKLVDADFEQISAYGENSLLMNLDPYDVCVADVVLYVSNDYKIVPELNYQDPDYITPLLAAYAEILQNHEALDKIAEQAGMEERYLEELITISYDSDARSLSIRVASDSIERSQTILDALLQVQKDAKKTVEQAIGTHDVKMISSSASTVAWSELVDIQREYQERVASLEKNKSDLQDDYDLTMQNIQTEKRELAMLKVPKKPEGSGTAKYIVLGALLGMVVVMGCVTVRFISTGKVYSSAELHQRSGLEVLGRLAGDSRKQKGVNGWLDRLERRPEASENDTIIQLTAVMIKNLEPQAQNVLITGDISAEKMNALRDQLQAAGAMVGKTVTVAESILKSPNTVDQVLSADAILLAVDCQTTRYDSIRVQNEKIQALGKKILGCVVYE